MTLKRIEAGVLEIAYHDLGPADGAPVILLHGFPYDPRCYDDVADMLAAKGHRCITPYLRGYGPTRFLSNDTPRSGEQAALGADLLALMDALDLPRATLAGYDWGGRAACIVAALWPDRVTGLVSCGEGYNIQNIAAAGEPGTPEEEERYWYQYLFHTDRGRKALEAQRRAFCRHIWKIWSPTWDFDDATYEASAVSFDNPDFVDIVLHSYRHRFGGVWGDPAYAAIEARLANRPKIAAPTIVLRGDVDGVDPAAEARDVSGMFTGPFEARVLKGIGHNPPQETPEQFMDAILSLR